jgi:hypothetical protein
MYGFVFSSFCIEYPNFIGGASPIYLTSIFSRQKGNNKRTTSMEDKSVETLKEEFDDWMSISGRKKVYLEAVDDRGLPVQLEIYS